MKAKTTSQNIIHSPKQTIMNTKTFKRKIWLCCIAIVFSLTGKAQLDTAGINSHTWYCGMDSLLFAKQLNDTAFVNSMARYNTSVGAGATYSTTTTIIPVVFHVVYPTGATPISYAQIQWQVAALNAAFKDQLVAFANITPGARDVNTNIEFRLACTPMPSSATTNTASLTGYAGWSNPTQPGVVYYPTATSNTLALNPGVLDFPSNNALKALTHPTIAFFPFGDYLNIWCVPNIPLSGSSGTVLGFGTFPWLYPATPPQSVIDGIVMRSDCIGNNTYPTGFPITWPYNNAGFVLAHEAGHYLGLFHTFQPQVAGSLTVASVCGNDGITAATSTTEGDLIADTPPSTINFDLGNIPTINSCQENYAPYGGSVLDQPDQLENYMCYSNDYKRNTFTAGQASRMAATFSITTTNNRNYLVSSTNLSNTGVNSTPTSCSNYTNILTAIFNWAFIAVGCTDQATIQFTTPTSTGFSATSYTWNFGDTSPNSFSSCPTHTYTSSTQSLYTVTCTAASGTATATYSTVISTATSGMGIVGCSGSTNTVSPYNSTVCRGKEETIYISFAPNIPTATITDGTYTYTVNNSLIAYGTTVTIPFLITINATASYSLVPYCNNGIANFNVTDCCLNMLTNGDFESGNVGFTTDLEIFTGTPPLGTSTPGNTWWGAYDVNAPTTTGSYFHSLSAMTGAHNITGKVLQVDGFYGPNTANTAMNSFPYVPPTPLTVFSGLLTSTLTPRVWEETVTGLLPNTPYFFSFKILENYASSLNFQTTIKSSSITALPTQSFAPILAVAQQYLDWQIYTYTFVTTNSVTPSMTFTIDINQKTYFKPEYYDYMVDNITLQAMTPIVQALGTNTICPSGSAPLSATANCGSTLSAYSYVWSPAASVSCYTCSSTTATPSTTTVYTLVATSTSTLSPPPPGAITTVTVTVIPTPTITVTGGTHTVCTGSATTTLTASGATNYTWSPSSGLSCTNCSTTIASPTVSTTYTVIGSNGCTATSTATESVVVATASCIGTQPSTYTITSNTTFTASPGLINQNLYITSGNFTINSTDVTIAPGVSIIVSNGAGLTINNSWLHACVTCSAQMWQGIVVKGGSGFTQGGALWIGGSIIEDAVQAVYTSVCTGALVSSTYTVTSSIFNNNATGIYIDANTANLSGNQIYSTLFTCRSLTNHSPTTGNISAIYSDVSNATPLLTSTVNPTDLTIAGSRSSTGVYVNTGNITNPVNVGLNNGLSANIFDNMDYGIYANLSSLTAANNIFQNLTGNNSGGAFGVGIYSTAGTPCRGRQCGVPSTLIVGTNTTTKNLGASNNFRNCLIGVYTNKMLQVYINGNFFNNETTATTFTTSGSYVTGQYGVYQYCYSPVNITNSTSEEMIFTNNTIGNYATGHFLDFAVLTNTLSASAGGSAYIFNNSISATGTSNQYCTTGLYLQQSVAQGANSGVPKDAINITSNSIINVNTNAIYANNVNTISASSGFLQIYDNQNLSVKYNAANTSLQMPRVAAVFLSNSPYTRVTYNPVVGITGYYGSMIPTARYHGGIYVYGSTNNTINCNTVTNTGEDIVYEGTCTGANNTWQENTMNYSWYGLVLRGTGILGDQGSSTYPINDNFNVAANFTGAQTMCENSNPSTSGSSSKLFMPSSYIPTSNAVYGGGTAAAYTTVLPVTLNTASGSNTLTCGASGTGDRMVQGTANTGNESAQDSLWYQNMQNGLNTNNTIFPMYDHETRWALQYLVSSHRPDLSAINGYGGAKTLALADAALANNNYGQALTLMNSFSASNIIESNWKSVDNILIKLQTDSLNASDISTLQSIAIQCPHIGGNIVWSARALLNGYYRSIVAYPNDCPADNASQGDRIQNNATGTTNGINGSNSTTIYPNPNSGSFTISYEGSGKQLTAEAYNVMGQQVFNQQFTITNNLNIPVTGLSEGVYFIKINVDNTLVKTQKIIVTK